MRLIPLVLSLFLFGCATEGVVYKEVKIPVAVPCLKEADVPKAVVVVDNPGLGALDDYSLVLTVYSERLQLMKHTGELHALIQACISRQ